MEQCAALPGSGVAWEEENKGRAQREERVGDDLRSDDEGAREY
jgi:hypothetical protein